MTFGIFEDCPQNTILLSKPIKTSGEQILMSLFYIQVKKQQSVFHLPTAQLGDRYNFGITSTESRLSYGCCNGTFIKNLSKRFG